MASIIKIKRSTGSAPPNTLGSGEIAYAWDEAGGYQNGKLFIGTGSETLGAAANVEIIGGKYFTNLLDHTPGTVTVSSAVIVDSNKKVNEWFVDNIAIDGNTISTTDANGNLVLAPTGTGLVSIASAYTMPRIPGTAGYVLSTDGIGTASWTQPPPSSFTINGNTGTHSFSTGETLTIAGAGALSTTITDNTVTLNVTDATTATKGVASFATTNFTVSEGSVSIKVAGIPNSALVNNNITIGNTSIALGSDSTILDGLTSITSDEFIGELTGNASTATTLQTARTVGISGPITGTATSFNGSTNITIPVTALDVAHTNVTGVLAVDHGGTGTTTSTGAGSLVLNTSPEFAGIPTGPTASSGTNTSQLATTEFVRAEVDAARSGLDLKQSVKRATTTNITLFGTQIIDGGTVAVSDRVLVKNQTLAEENGIYTVQDGVWTRASDADAGTELSSGSFVFVEQGTTNADSGWLISGPDAPFVIGTDPLIWNQFSGAGQITAGAGLVKSGNTINVLAGAGIFVGSDSVALTGQALALHNLNANGIFVRTAAGVVAARTVSGTTDRVVITNGDGVSGNPTVDIANTYEGQNTITTLGTITTGVWEGNDISVEHGGTGVSSLTARGVLYGNGTAAVGVTGTSSIDGSFLREDATGNPYWSNVIDGGSY
jgi:hypothetical protein